MNIGTKRKDNRKKWWIGGGVVLVLVIAVVVAVVALVSRGGESEEVDKSDTSAAVEEQKKNESVQDDVGDEPGRFAEEEMAKKKVTQYEGDDPNEAEVITGAITYAEVNEGLLSIRVNMDQYLTSGACELALFRDGVNVYNSVANVLPVAATATCEGFDVPVSEIGSGTGTMEIVINVKTEEKTGEIRGRAEV